MVGPLTPALAAPYSHCTVRNITMATDFATSDLERHFPWSSSAYRGHAAGHSPGRCWASDDQHHCPTHAMGHLKNLQPHGVPRGQSEYRQSGCDDHVRATLGSQSTSWPQYQPAGSLVPLPPPSSCIFASKIKLHEL